MWPRALLLLKASVGTLTAQQVIHSLQPAVATAGGPAFTMAVRGTGFSPASRVLWNNTPLTTRFEDATLLRADVVPARIASAGKHAVSVGGAAVLPSLAVEFTVNPPLQFASTALVPAQPGAFYSNALLVIGGTPPMRTVVAAGVLPPGLHMDSMTGTISGYPETEGSFSFTVQVTDSTGAALHHPFTLLVARPPRLTGPPVLPAAMSGRVYWFTLTAQGGVPPYGDWAVTDGLLPEGLRLDPLSGVISGMPVTAGMFRFAARVRDSASRVATGVFQLEVHAPLAFGAAVEQPAMAGEPFRRQLTVSGGAPPFTWRVLEGSPPPGVQLEVSTGWLAGTPTAPGEFQLRVEARDSRGEALSRIVRILVLAPLDIRTDAVVAEAVVGRAFRLVPEHSGGAPPYRWRITSGEIPGGLSLDQSSGAISGTPARRGRFTFQLELADAAGRSLRTIREIVVTLPALAPLALGLSGALEPGSQARVHPGLAAPYPVDLDCRLELSFRPSVAPAPDDPALLFATGGRSAAFRIAAGDRQSSTGLSFQTGTTAGTVRFEGSCEAQGEVLALAPDPNAFEMAGRPPSVRRARAERTSSGFEVILNGFSNTRELTRARFELIPAPGALLESSTLAVELEEMARTWYQSAESAAFGGQFTYRQPFRVNGAAAALAFVAVTLENSIGPSDPQRVALE